MGNIGINTENILKTVHDGIKASFLSEDETVSSRKALGYSKGNCDTLLKLQDNHAEIIFKKIQCYFTTLQTGV